MSLSESFQAEVADPSRTLRRLVQRTPQAARLLLAILLALAVEYPLSLAFQPPGLAIRHELEAAAGELHSQLFPQATPATRAALRAHFGDRDVDIDVKSAWPSVGVALHDVARAVCVDAVLAARRIDDPTVVDLEGYGRSEDCRERNEMRWWIRP